MANGLADLFSNKEALADFSNFLLGFGRDISLANARGFSPLSSIAFGIGGGGVGIEEGLTSRQLRASRAQQARLREQQIEKEQRESQARQFLSGAMTRGGQVVSAGLAPSGVPLAELPLTSVVQAGMDAGIVDTDAFRDFINLRRGIATEEMARERLGIAEEQLGLAREREQRQEERLGIAEEQLGLAREREQRQEERLGIAEEQLGLAREREQRQEERSEQLAQQFERQQGLREREFSLSQQRFAEQVGRGALLDRQGNVKPTVSNALARQSATLVGGGFDAVGNPIGLNPETARQAQQIQLRASRALQDKEASSISEAMSIATNEVLGALTPEAEAVTRPETAPQPEATQRVPPDIDISLATGASGAFGNIANIVADAFGQPLVAPETDKAIKVLDDLRVTTRLALAKGVSGRPSNLLLESFDQLAVAPGSLVQGDARSFNRLNQTRNFLFEEIRERERLLENPQFFTEKQVTDTREAVASLKGLTRAYDQAIAQFGSKLLKNLTLRQVNDASADELRGMLLNDPSAKATLDAMPDELRAAILAKLQGR